MRSLVFLLTVCGALADTKTSVNVPEVPVDPKLKVDGHDVDFVTTNRRGELFSVLFDEGYSIRDAETLFAVSPSQRGDSGLPEIIPGIPTEVLIVAVIAKIILIIIISTQLDNEGMNNLGTVPVTPIDDTVNDVLGNNPNLLNTLATTILPSLLPLLISEGREQIDTDLIMDKTDATAFARMDGVKGELYFAQIKPTQKGQESATVIAGALQGFKPLSTYKISLHKSGDTTNACSNVGELYTGTKEHQFKTDTEGRSVLLLHESGLRIRGKDGIMGRSVVITDPQGAEARHCGIVINA